MKNKKYNDPFKKTTITLIRLIKEELEDLKLDYSIYIGKSRYKITYEDIIRLLIEDYKMRKRLSCKPKPKHRVGYYE